MGPAQGLFGRNSGIPHEERAQTGHKSENPAITPVPMDCMEKSLFGSNKPWPLEIKQGDFCLLHHYEIGGLLGLWQATSNGGKNIVPKIWGSKFPYQVRIKLAIPKALEVPKSLLMELGVDPSLGRFDHVVDDELTERILDFFGIR